MSVSEGVSDSRGDPRVLLVLNAVLSAAFVGIVLSAADFAGMAGFTWTRFAMGTLVLMALTLVVTR